MKITILQHTLEPEKLLSEIASICYKSEPSEKILETVLKNKHHSVLEHAYITFKIENISRVCSHQLVRHRIGCSYTQESQRYVNLLENTVIIPPSIKENETAKLEFKEYMEKCLKYYEKLINSDIKKEDSRFCLPQAVDTNIIVTFNFRSFLHFYTERTCPKSQWEIKEVADTMKELIKYIAPTYYNYLIPRCKMYNDINCKNKNCLHNQ